MRKIILLIACLPIFMACSESGPVDSEPSAGTPRVVASNYPLYWFATQIAGDAIDVRLPEMQGDPAQWTPVGQVGLLQSADLVVINGAGYESWLSFTTLPAGRLLDTTATVADQLIPLQDGVVHQHGPEGEHSHQGTAFTTWLDPTLAISQADAVRAGMTQLAPDSADQFQQAFEDLEARISGLDFSMGLALAVLGDEPVVFSHPVYQYLERHYGINGRSLHWEPDVAPGTRDMIDLQNLLREHPARVIIWESAPLPETEALLGELGIRSVVFDPMGNRPLEGDYASGMEANIARLSVLARLLNGR